MDNFAHEVLGDMSDETRWFKILRTTDLLRLCLTVIVCILMLNIFPKTGFFILSEVGLMLATCVRVLLGIITKPKSAWLKGGGVDYFNLIKRKIYYKKSNKVYSLGTEDKYNGCQ